MTLLISTGAYAQENSPYSRYGLGDLTPNQNIVTRGMGGIAAGYSDYQSINFVNPASYGNLSYLDSNTLRRNPAALRNTIFDIGAEVDTRVLKGGTPPTKFSATNLLISYLQLGLPIKIKKLNKKGIFLGISMGLKPVSRINYKVYGAERKSNIDSVLSIYEGSGGMSEANIGAGLRIKKLNIGFNTGYRFGNKDYSTSRYLVNDTVFYYPSRNSYKTNFGGMFLNTGVQYELNFKNKAGKDKGTLRLGGYGNLKRNITASQDVIKETITSDASGNIVRIDSVYVKNEKGIVVYPASFGAGFTYQDSSNHWLIGADYEKTYWSGYSFFNQKDQVKDSWRIRAGAEYLPATINTPLKKYFNFVRYRAGFYYGTDYINPGSNLPEYGLTLGAGFPLKLRRGYYESQISYLNTAIEIGSRGNNKNSLRESIFRISVGFSLSDLWFSRSKYY